MCVEKSVQMFVKLGRENPHLFDWIEKQCKMGGGIPRKRKSSFDWIKKK